jgi:hypothetical protein
MDVKQAKRIEDTVLTLATAGSPAALTEALRAAA